MSVDREVDLEASQPRIVERRELTVDDLFQDDQLRLEADATLGKMSDHVASVHEVEGTTGT